MPGLFYYLIIALVISVMLSMIWHLDTMVTITKERKLNRKPYHGSDPTLMIDERVARDLRSHGRVLCWIPSAPKYMENRVKAVNSTWVQRCDGHIFFVENLTSQHPDVVSLDVPTGYNNLATKVIVIIQYLYRHHLNDYDWFVKCDDDSYVVVENLRYLLSLYDSASAAYVGHLYKKYHSQGYMSGGASYAISKGALKLLVEEGYMKNKCPTKGQYEDVMIGSCLHSVGVPSLESRDRFGRETFHPLKAGVHIVGPIPANQIPQDRFLMVADKECCSQLTVSFHKVDPSMMRIFDHLLYRTSVYGRQQDLSSLQDLVRPAVIPPLP